jgi:small basic protein
MIAALALAVGVIVGLILHPTVPAWLEPYLPIAVVAALDAVFGGVRARLDKIFDAKVFVVSFVSNVLVAVVLGIRIFGNAAAIRRHLFRA